MGRMRIGLDLDGVFYNFGDSVKRYLDSIGEGHIWKSGPTPEPYWDFYKDWGYTSAQFVDLCNRGADAGYIFTGPMRDGGKNAWDELVLLDQEIVVITDRGFGSDPSVSQNATLDWLEENDLWYDELVFSADKAVVPTDLFIDDKLENYERLTEAGTLCYLLNRPWNLDPELGVNDGRNRIDNLEQYVDAVYDAIQNLGPYIQ